MSSSETSSDDSDYIPIPRVIRGQRFEEKDLMDGLDYNIYGEHVMEETRKKAEEEFDNLYEEPSAVNDSPLVTNGRILSSLTNNTRALRSRSKEVGLSDGCEDIQDCVNLTSPSPSKDHLREPTPPPSIDLKRTAVSRTASRRGKGSRQTRRRGGSVAVVNAPIVISEDEDAGEVVIIASPSRSAQRKKLIKVRTAQGTIKRFPMAECDSFDHVIAELAEEAAVPAERVELYVAERRVHEYDTPHSQQLTVADILEMHVCRAGNEEAEQLVSDEAGIQIQVQSNKSRERGYFTIQKSDPLDRLIRLYCKKFSLNNVTAQLSFDGDIIEKWKTPNDLEMEDEDCIDIMFN